MRVWRARQPGGRQLFRALRQVVAAGRDCDHQSLGARVLGDRAERLIHDRLGAVDGHGRAIFSDLVHDVAELLQGNFVQLPVDAQVLVEVRVFVERADIAHLAMQVADAVDVPVDGDRRPGAAAGAGEIGQALAGQCKQRGTAADARVLAGMQRLRDVEADRDHQRLPAETRSMRTNSPVPSQTSSWAHAPSSSTGWK